MSRQKKPALQAVEYSVADAIENGLSDLTTLRDELQEWYDNMPENFQSADKGSQLEEAIGELDEAESVDHDALTGSTDDDGKPCEPASLRFNFMRSTKKRMSRADRCDEATSLLRSAHECVTEWLDGAVENDDGSKDRDDDGTIADALSEVQDVIDRAEGVTFPGMFG